MNAEHDGPVRIDDVIAIWRRIARTAEVLHAMGVLRPSLTVLRARIAAEAQANGGAVQNPDLFVILRVLAAPDRMTAHDWLRMKVVETSRRLDRPGHQLDLRGLRCKRLVIAYDERGDVVVTVENRRGDVASVVSCNLGNALDGAIRMAGARTETT